VAIVALAAVGMLAAIVGAPVAIRAVAGLPLVTFLPGYTLVAWILADRIDRVQRWVLAAATTLCVDVLVGVLLYLTPRGLTPPAWAVVLGGISIVGVAGAATSRPLRPGHWLSGVKASRARVQLVAIACVGLAVAAGAVL